MVNNTPKTKPIVEMQPILKPCFKIKRGHWKTCRAKNAPYLGRTSPYPPFHWVPPPGVFSYSLLSYSIAPSDYVSLNWMKIVKIQKIVPKTRHLLKFGGHFEKSALTALSSTGIFAGNLISIALWLRFPKIVVSKNPPGVQGFGYWPID